MIEIKWLLTIVAMVLVTGLFMLGYISVWYRDYKKFKLEIYEDIESLAELIASIKKDLVSITAANKNQIEAIKDAMEEIEEMAKRKSCMEVTAGKSYIVSLYTTESDSEEELRRDVREINNYFQRHGAEVLVIFDGFFRNGD